ncbi:unnamed protein product [Clonostachys rosea]|uniref:Uncharacterized protein n=1 Tax=Bionectria ochroleuca TaxID=29856 RepID=A0ABY6TMU2_BIOOC|nr:unnamed protein product [Clonostachys rosea]
MNVTFEGTQYQCGLAHPNIPYTIYVHDYYLLLVPRQVGQAHKEFPNRPFQELKRVTLQISDFMVNDYQEKYKRAPKFSHQLVAFGYEEDEGVVVAAWLEGSDTIAYWDFRTIFSDDKALTRSHYTDECSDPEDSFRCMQYDLAEAA